MKTTDEIIRESGLRVTPQRRLVYETMLELRHATIDDISTFVAGKDSRINLSTVYRIVETFCNAHLLTMVFHPSTGKCFYDIAVAEHHHFFDGVGVIDFSDPQLSEIIKNYLKASGRYTSLDVDKIQVQITVADKSEQ